MRKWWPEIVLFIFGIGAFVTCGINEEQNRSYCKPVCQPYIYKYRNEKGNCVCNLNLMEMETR